MTGRDSIPPWLEPEAIAAFSDDARRAVYEVIALRRDVRHFQPGREIDDSLLERVLGAAHLAPSVGFSQPWGFVVVRDRKVRAAIRESFLRCRQAEAARYPPGRREEYLAHRLEGILESVLNLCVAVDLRPQGEAVLGTTAQPEAVRASACCAVQNLWLASRAEGIGVGWVSIVEPEVLRKALALPPGVEPIAYLCMGYPIAFRTEPMLEETGWRRRRPLAEVIHWRDRWQEDASRPAAAAQSGDASPDPRTGAREAPSASLAQTIAKGTPRSSIAPPSEAARAAAVAHQRMLAKPQGSLGRLEELAAFYAAARGQFPPPAPERAALALFAADHGVVAEGVSAYGSQLTAAVVGNVMAGGSAVNVIGRASRVEIVLVDLGVAGDRSALPSQPIVPLLDRRIQFGTRNLRREPAMDRRAAERALEAGADIVSELAASGVDLLGVGEIGIGNTTAAAALVCAFSNAPPDRAVGSGTGVEPAVRERKVRVVADALALHRPDRLDPIDRLAALGGLEIAALAGAMLEAARRRIPVVLDGFVTHAAALCAAAIDPGVRGYLLASHASAEPGSKIALAELGLEPLLDWGLRLGEGTGAALVIPMVRTAVETELAMATFATAGIAGRAGTELAR